MEQVQPRLLVLDTSTALIKRREQAGEHVFRSQYAEVSVVRKLAEDFHTAVVLVHHARVARLQQGTSAAATTLLKTMIDPNTPASVRVRAAEAIFNHSAKAIEIEDIEARVAELERTMAAEEKTS